MCDAGSCFKTHQDTLGTLQVSFKTPQDAYRIRFWGLLGPSWAPRRSQDATKTYPRAAQNTSQDALGSQNRPDTQNRSKMNSLTPQNRPPNLVGKLQNRAKTLLENFENPAQTLLENFRNRTPNPPKSNPNRAKRGPGGAKKPKTTSTQRKEGHTRNSFPHCVRKSGQHGSKLGPKL